MKELENKLKQRELIDTMTLQHKVFAEILFFTEVCLQLRN